MPKRYTRLTKPELIAKLERLEKQAGSVEALRRSLVDLQMQYENLRIEHQSVSEARDTLAHARALYEHLFNGAPFAYLIMGVHGRIEKVNSAAAGLFGQDDAEIVGEPFTVWIVGADIENFYDHLRRCARSHSTVRTELRLRTVTGRIFPVEIFSRAVSVGDGYATAISDISSRIQIEAERHRAEEERYRSAAREQAARAASEAKDRFFAILSHELRTPLAPIVNTVTKLKQNADLPPELRAAVDMIHRNADLQTRLIDDLLDITRSIEGKLQLNIENVDLHAVVREVVEALREQARAAGMSIRLHLAARRHFVRADPGRLHQVVANLLRNAIQHSYAAGEIVVESSNASPSRTRLSVTDSGAGIDRKDLERIFDPFEQVSAPGVRSAGLGLGLAIAKSLAQAQGGWIEAFSEGPGTGARFTFELEAADAPPMRLLRPAATGTGPRGTVRILIVEDHVDTALSLAELLNVYGYETRLAHTFESALAAAGEEFDVVISDIALPDGSGLELMRKLHESRGVDGIALSGFGAETDVIASRRAGFKEHITKPADVRVLLAAIERVASRRGRTPPRGH